MTTGQSSTASCGSCVPARLGVICPNATAPGRPVQIGSIAGAAMARGTGCSPTCRPNRMRWARSSGKSVLTVRRPAPTNTPVARGVGPVGPMKEGDPPRPRRRVRAQPRRTDDQVSSGLRWQRPSALDRHHGGATPWQYAVGRCPGRHARSAPRWAWTPTPPSGPADCRQEL